MGSLASRELELIRSQFAFPLRDRIVTNNAASTQPPLAVLELAAAGLRNHEIAGELTVTVHTVKQHLKHAYQKLGVRSRVEAIRHL